jgi:hypothetical protein
VLAIPCNGARQRVAHGARPKRQFASRFRTIRKHQLSRHAYAFKRHEWAGIPLQRAARFVHVSDRKGEGVRRAPARHWLARDVAQQLPYIVEQQILSAQDVPFTGNAML